MGTLWTGNIRTMEHETAAAQAVYVDNRGIIQAVGNAAELKHRFAPDINEEIDISPNVIYPGFVDSHLHIMSHGLKLLRLDLSISQTSNHMKELITQKAAQTTPGSWLFGEGWNENNFPDRKIFHRRELDAIAPHHPMALTRVCRHAMLANSQALSLAGIDKETPDPPGGVIVRDNEQQPTGLLLDQAQELLMKAIPGLTKDELTHTAETAVDHLLSLGITGAHTEDLYGYGRFDPAFSIYREIIDDERPLKTHLLVHHEAVDVMREKGYYPGWHENNLSLGSMKIFADGAFGGRTALLRQPYNDMPETNGVAIHSRNQLIELVKKARTYGMPVAVHTIGDLALEYALDAIEMHPVKDGWRDRIIHGQVAPPDLRARLKRLPVFIDIQPQFVPSDFPWVIERLGEHRLQDAYAWKTLLNEGIICAGSSDAPIEYVNPLFGIHAACTRRKAGEEHSYSPGQCLSVYEAINLYTYGSNYAIGQEHHRGRILPGFEADFAVLDKDLLSLEGDDLLTARNVMTVIDGKIVYAKK